MRVVISYEFPVKLWNTPLNLKLYYVSISLIIFKTSFYAYLEWMNKGFLILFFAINVNYFINAYF